MSHDTHTTCVKLSDRIYRDLEKIAYIKGTSIEQVILDALVPYLHIVRDIDDHYRFEYEKVVEERRKLSDSALSNGIIKKTKKIPRPQDIAFSLGKLVTLLEYAYGAIPRELVLDNIGEDEQKRLYEAMVKIEGRRDWDPRRYLLKRIKEIKEVAPAFGIEILKDKGSIKILKFNNVNLLATYSNYTGKDFQEKA